LFFRSPSNLISIALSKVGLLVMPFPVIVDSTICDADQPRYARGMLQRVDPRPIRAPGVPAYDPPVNLIVVANVEKNRAEELRAEGTLVADPPAPSLLTVGNRSVTIIVTIWLR
jgi:hypothetical protein